MSVLLFGSGGQVGRELCRTLLPFGKVTAATRAEVDLENTDALKAYLEAQRPAVVVNAAAYTAVDLAETETKQAEAINHEAVATMSQYCSETGGLLVHYSTDYVFDGEKTTPYVETDSVNPQSVYGRTKCAGEVAVLASGCDALVFRTSWVFSAKGKNFIKTMLRLAQQKNSLNVVSDQIGAPTSAELIADVTAAAIVGFRKGGLATGIYHLTASGSTSWHGLAQYVVAQAQAQGMSMELSSDAIIPIPTEDYPVPAVRPKNSRLETAALCNGLGLSMPDWRVHVDRMLDQLNLSENMI